MSDFKIIRISILPFGLVNAHLIKGPNGCILVDAGLPGSENKIEKVLKSEGLSWRDIKLIVITHAHVDHAGSAASVRELTGAPIVAHVADVRHFSREVPMTFCSTGWFGNLFIKTGLMFEPYVGFKPDILLANDEKLDLKDYGFNGHVQHSPGHTAGSISVELESRDAFVGDLLTSGILLGGLMMTNTPKRPPFEDDPRVVAVQLQRFVDAGMSQFYMGHGGPLSKKEVQAHILNLSKK